MRKEGCGDEGRIPLFTIGDDAWFLIASKLRPFSDAGATETLEMSVAEALPKNPKAALKLIEKGFSLDWVCGEPYFEVPNEKILNHLHKALKSLRGVNDPSLIEIKTRCGKQIQDLIGRIGEDKKK